MPVFSPATPLPSKRRRAQGVEPPPDRPRGVQVAGGEPLGEPGVEQGREGVDAGTKPFVLPLVLRGKPAAS